MKTLFALIFFLTVATAFADAPRLTITSWEQYQQHKLVNGEHQSFIGSHKDAAGDHWLFVISWTDPTFSYGLMQSRDCGKNWFISGSSFTTNSIFRLERDTP